MIKNLRQEIIDSLLENLPTVAVSISKIVDNLQLIIKNESLKNKETVDFKILSNIIDELDNFLPDLNSFIQKISAIDEDIKSGELLSLYKDGLTNLISGIKNMLIWIRNYDEPEDTLIKSINVLFLSGQQISELVNILTEGQ